MSIGDNFFDGPPNANLAPSPKRIVVMLPAAARRWPLALCSATVPTIVMLAPIPLASNHPLAWLFWATTLGATATVISAFRTKSDALVMRRHRIFFALGLLFAAFALFQAAPLPMLRGGLPVHFPAGPVKLPSLSIAPGASLISIARIGAYLILFWLALRAGRNPTRGRAIGALILFAIAGHALTAILALKLFGDINYVTEKPAYFGLATGTFINKNSFATFLGMGVVLGLALIKYPQHRKDQVQLWQVRRYQALAVVVIVAALILTQSRMGIFSTLVAAAVVILPPTRFLTYILALTLAAIAIILATQGLDVLARFPDLQSSIATRIELYKQLLGMILARPLTGFGLGSFPLAYELYHAPPVTANFIWDRGHSTYLTLWVEAGIIAGSIPALAGTLAARKLWRRSIQQCPGRTMARAALGALILCALHSLVDFSLEIQANAFLLIALVSLSLAPPTPRQEPANGNR